MNRFLSCLLCLFCLSAWLAAGAARAELAPEQIAILALERSPDSQELAKYYAAARRVPEANILVLPGTFSTEISRPTWENEVRPAIRAWVKEKGLALQIRCFVTCLDVPLRIGRRDPNSPVVVARKEFLTGSRKVRVDQMTEILKSLAELGGSRAADQEPLPADAPLKVISRRLEPLLRAAERRVSATTAEPERQKLSSAFQRLVAMAGGARTALLAASSKTNPAAMDTEHAVQFALVSGRVQGYQQGYRALSSLPDSVARDTQILNLVQAIMGLTGSIDWIDQELELLRQNNTHSSFDSELSLLYWPDYPLFGWHPNLLQYAYDELNVDRTQQLMVSRLAAPTLTLAKGLVDKAISAERNGLKGTVYLDARGLRADTGTSPDASGAYDQSLRDLAQRLKEHTQLRVVLNNGPGLFQPGECPDAALYCGWYSLRKYVDAFDWRPGAVGYHLAGQEAEELSEPGSTVWCSAMLEDGITATLGAVSEPDVRSFPLPDLFFSLLLTGRYTLVETYYRTNPFNSWVLVLIGDPLYNPFKANPLLHEDNLPDMLNPKKRAEMAAAARQRAQPGSAPQAKPEQQNTPPAEKKPESPAGGLHLPGME